jgi:hypothetical protein
MVSALKSQVEELLGGAQHRVTAAIMTSSDRIRLNNEEVTDVFDYVGMRNLMGEPDDLEDLQAAAAAYAGFGLGLCLEYIDPYKCEMEEYQFPYQRFLHLDFSPQSLNGAIGSRQCVRNSFVQ